MINSFVIAQPEYFKRKEEAVGIEKLSKNFLKNKKIIKETNKTMAKKEEKKEEKTPEKIEVDKEFLMEVAKSLENLKTRFNQFEQGILEKKTSSTPSASPQPDHIFQCVKIISISRIPPTPEDMTHYKQLDKEFEKEL